MDKFRALFPYWNFFDRVSFKYELEFKAFRDSDWQKLSFDQNRSLWGLFVNPRVNLAMAQMNLIEHFIMKQDEANHRILCALVFAKTQSDHFKFRIVADTELYESEWIQWSRS